MLPIKIISRRNQEVIAKSVSDRQLWRGAAAGLSSLRLSGKMFADILVGKMHQVTGYNDLWAQRPKVKVKNSVHGQACV